MAMSASFKDIGSDEVRDEDNDNKEVCSSCAADGKLQPSQYFCFNCGEYGRHICGSCLKHHNRWSKNHEVESVVNQSSSRRHKLMADLKTKLEDRAKQIEDLEIGTREKDKEIKELKQELNRLSVRLEEENVKRSKNEMDQMYTQNIIQDFEKQANDYCSEAYSLKSQIEELETKCKNLEKEKSKVEKVATKNIEHLQGILKEEKRNSDDQYKKVLAERDDLRDRDPNRAMKLSEKFGQLYDDEWTNAFEYLTDKKGGLLQLRDAINVLLRLFQECWTFCNNMMETQMEILHSVFLHPDQNPTKYVNQAIKVVDKPRITSKDTQTLMDLRRRIGVSPSVLEEVKQTLLVASKMWEKEEKGFDRKHIYACAPYTQKCAEICWLMALHDPPLFMKMEVKQGEKLDPNIYTVYSASGTTIDFLVWPPLYNGKDGGLLSKGVAEPLRVVSKKKLT